MLHSRNHVIIDLSALAHNFAQVKDLVSPGTKIMGIVKSDAYGHGLVPVARVIEKQGVNLLGVAHLHEAMDLRKNGIAVPVVLLCGVRTEEEAGVAIEEGLIPVLSDEKVAETVADECRRRGAKIRVLVKVDTGMGRLGIPDSELRASLKKIMDHEELIIEGLMSHLSSADELTRDFTDAQIRSFKGAIEVGHAMGLDLPVNTLANSAGIAGYKDSHFQMVRPGISLYGGMPGTGNAGSLDLKPVMHFRGEILQIREMPCGRPISYGHTYYTHAVQRIAVTSAGYGDGLSRSLSNRGKVLINGHKVSILGRVCMNMTMADITGLGDVRPGDEVVFLGSQAGNRITGDELAEWSQTISYEVFCSIGQRNSKEYVQ
jgi:alanine racemase